MRVVATDPRLQGGIAVLDQEQVVLLTDLPVHRVGVAGKKRLRAELDLHGLHGLLAEHGPYVHAFIEKVNSRPGEGVTGAFRLASASARSKASSRRWGFQ